MRLIDEDKVFRVIKRFYGYLGEDMIERINIEIKKIPTAAAELNVESDPIIKRLRHLLESEYIRSFDEVDPRTQEYKRDIREADKGRAAPETAPYCRFRTPCGICEAYTRRSSVIKCRIESKEGDLWQAEHK